MSGFKSPREAEHGQFKEEKASFQASFHAIQSYSSLLKSYLRPFMAFPRHEVASRRQLRLAKRACHALHPWLCRLHVGRAAMANGVDTAFASP